MPKGRVATEIVSCCLDSVDIVKETVAAIRKAMIEDINLVENYSFPEELPISISVDVGYAWGEAMSLDEYIERKK